MELPNLSNPLISSNSLSPGSPSRRVALVTGAGTGTGIGRRTTRESSARAVPAATQAS